MRVLLEGDDGYRVERLEDREIYEAVENLYVLDAASAACSRSPTCCRARWRLACTSGSRAAATPSLFDNVDDTLTVERLQVFDFEAMRAYPALLEPLLFYVLHRVDDADPGSRRGARP